MNRRLEFTVSSRAALEAKVQVITELRRELQYAVDTLWPGGVLANTAIRPKIKSRPTNG